MTIVPGTWFEVPLGDGRSAAGLVVAIGSTGIGYFAFFKRLVESPVKLEDCARLGPDDVLFALRTGTSEFDRGAWRALGVLSSWSPLDWVIPRFLRRPVHDGKYYAVEYSADDPGVEVSTIPVSEELATALPPDGVWTATTALTRLRRHFQSSDEVVDVSPALPMEYALIVELRASSPASSIDEVHKLQDEIESELKALGIGELDGDESGSDGIKLFFTGPDGWKILAAVDAGLTSGKGWRPYSAQVRSPRGTAIPLRYNPRTSRWERIP
ncbi:hypothetical protein ITJ43_03380 [Microbacterium sp. VKM Ac-2870]|uniref:Imm26 family immunity protein n=1 Tax=Microbacterium sp. VKM Ac-2870 TaxID=2783825 RepID=UPI00188BAC67|nr:Imm26 family immunity protein [Microbacterium sp. VKM Ac-2870]MBF4561168.1 hypothetical protein [Microbacterium sp. VKM Ac-2870]